MTPDASLPVSRGGSWRSYPRLARVARRVRDAPGVHAHNLGLRLVVGSLDEGSVRVYRGGSWYGAPGCARVALRCGSAPSYRIDSLGFRLVIGRPLDGTP